MTPNERVLADPNSSTTAYLEAWKLQREHEAHLARVAIAAEERFAVIAKKTEERFAVIAKIAEARFTVVTKIAEERFTVVEQSKQK